MEFGRDGFVMFDPDEHIRGYRVAVLVGVDKLNRPRLAGLRIEPTADDAEPITARTVKSIPFGELVRRANALPHTGTRRYATWAELALELASPPERPRGGSAEFSSAVLDTFDQARASGLGGTTAIRKRWSVSEDTAQRWLREARKRLRNK